jgi:hypothetical protein
VARREEAPREIECSPRGAGDLSAEPRAPVAFGLTPPRPGNLAHPRLPLGEALLLCKPGGGHRASFLSLIHELAEPMPADQAGHGLHE